MKRGRYSIFIVAGGTFGHIRPAISVSNELEKSHYFSLFFCVKKDRRFPLIQERAKKQTVFLNMQGLPTYRTKIFQWLRFALLLFFSLIRTSYYFIFCRPKVVVASGGFVSFPILFWARLLRIPYFVLEQNSLPGLVSRIFFKKAKKIFFAMEPINPVYKNDPHSMIVGNPIQMEKFSKKDALDYFQLPDIMASKNIVGVIGGSLGAQALIDWSLSQEKLLEKIDVIIFCITGYSLYPSLKNYSSERLIFIPFVKDISFFYALSDIVLARSGASTISELFIYNKPSIFVPYPFATENHQFFNAQFALKYLKGCIIKQDDLHRYTVMDLYETIEKDKEPKINSQHLLEALSIITQNIKESL